MNHHLKRTLTLLLRVAVTLLVFWLIFRNINLDGVLQTMLGAEPGLLLLGLLFQLASTLLASWRWKLVMQRLGFGQDFVFYLRSYFKGSFFNQGLPTSIGGDALRVLDVARTGHRKRDAFYGVAAWAWPACWCSICWPCRPTRTCCRIRCFLPSMAWCHWASPGLRC